jgi:hypothetical protein
MADLTKKQSDEMFGGSSVYDEIRALLRATHTNEEIEKLSNEELVRTAQVLRVSLTSRRYARAKLAAHVARGSLTQEAVDRMTPEEADHYATADTAATLLREELDGSRAAKDASWEQPPAPPPDTLPASAVLTLLADMLSVIHAQQVELDELVEHEEAFLARFANRMLDKFKEFSDGGRNYKGFEVTLDLEDESSEKREKKSATKGEEQTSNTNTRDTHGEIKLLANQLGALGAGRNVNLEEMNRKVASRAASSRYEVRSRRRGKVTVKLGEVSGEAKPLVQSADE